MPLYHASVLHWEPGESIQQGGWGRRIKATGVRHPLYFREHELERARLRVNASLPSRWTCAFAFTDAADAHQHAATNSQQQQVPFFVYEVAAPAGAPQAYLPMPFIDTWWTVQLPESIDHWADNYWSQAGRTGPGTEVLVDGSLSVRQRVPSP